MGNYQTSTMNIEDVYDQYRPDERLESSLYRFDPEVDSLEAFMSEAIGEAEWNRRCDAVKAAHNGQYPSDWYSRVIQSGLAGSVRSQWRD